MYVFDVFLAQKKKGLRLTSYTVKIHLVYRNIYNVNKEI